MLFWSRPVAARRVSPLNCPVRGPLMAGAHARGQSKIPPALRTRFPAVAKRYRLSGASELSAMAGRRGQGHRGFLVHLKPL